MVELFYWKPVDNRDSTDTLQEGRVIHQLHFDAQHAAACPAAASLTIIFVNIANGVEQRKLAGRNLRGYMHEPDGVELMNPGSEHDAVVPTADSDLVCSGLRNRMDVMHVQNAAAFPSDKPDNSFTPSPSVAPADDCPDLTGERGCFMLLIVLYALQGSLLGLASGTLPFIIQVH
jgi:hypothetical protein